MSETLANPNPFYVEHQPGRDLRISDPALGYAYGIHRYGPQAMLYDVFTSSIARRALDVCQLSKSSLDDVIFGLESYRRFQHLTGAAEGVRHLGELSGITDDQLTTYSLVAILSDLAHGVQSHKTDMMIEGVGGREAFHESRLERTVHCGGLSEIFRHYGSVPNFAAKDLHATYGMKIPPWVENEDGRPNIDRFNYVAGESRIWFPDNELVESATSLGAVEIDPDGQMVFKDHDLARVWGKLGLLLSSEHWNEPVNRLIMIIGVETIKRSIFKRYLSDIDIIDNGHARDPEDYTFLCDSDFDEALKRVGLDKHQQDDFMTASRQMLRTLGEHERDRYETHKKQVYEEFLEDHGAREYPSAYVNPHIAKFGNLPVFVELLEDADKEQISQIEGRGRLLDSNGKPVGFLKNFKIRQFDPLVKDKDGSTVRLSAVDPGYEHLLQQHREAITYTEAMQLLMNRRATDIFCAALEENASAMQEARQNSRPLSADQLRRVIRGAGERATATAMARDMWREV